MRHLLALVALLTVGSPLGAQDDRVDAEGVRALTTAFSTAWAAHDPEGLAGLWVPDGDLVNPMGQTARGRVELAKLFREEHTSYMKGTALNVKVTATRVLGPGLALVDCDAHLTGVKTPDGKAMPPFKHLVVAVVTKSAEGWRFVSARLSVPVPPPPEK
jgi:uncharacterized protein (TIGR02246 family)